MLKAYDVAVKNLIQVFTNNIPVVGLQNEDSTETNERTLSQAGLEKGEEDKIPFPVISVFRNPEVQITDGSMTKRASTAEGYSWEDEKGGVYSLVAMRATLQYTVDIFDVAKASAEEIATKLFFRLRNNPEIKVNFCLNDDPHIVEQCVAEIQMGNTLTHIRLNNNTTTQAYKIRFTFSLVNANIYDVLSKQYPNLVYTVTVKLAEN